MNCPTKLEIPVLKIFFLICCFCLEMRSVSFPRSKLINYTVLALSPIITLIEMRESNPEVLRNSSQPKQRVNSPKLNALFLCVQVGWVGCPAWLFRTAAAVRSISAVSASPTRTTYGRRVAAAPTTARWPTPVSPHPVSPASWRSERFSTMSAYRSCSAISGIRSAAQSPRCTFAQYRYKDDVDIFILLST